MFPYQLQFTLQYVEQQTIVVSPGFFFFYFHAWKLHEIKQLDGIIKFILGKIIINHLILPFVLLTCAAITTKIHQKLVHILAICNHTFLSQTTQFGLASYLLAIPYS